MVQLLGERDELSKQLGLPASTGSYVKLLREAGLTGLAPPAPSA